jgi:gliding motility-associated-like protein
MKKIAVILICLILVAPVLRSQSVGGISSGSGIFCDSVNSGFISLTSYSGNILYWENSVNNGTTWNILANTQATQSYNNLNKTTLYRAIVKKGTFVQDTSSVSKIIVNVPGVKGSITGGGTFCGSANAGTLLLSGVTGTVINWQYSNNNGSSWTNVLNTSYTFPHGTINQNRLYRSILRTDTVCPADTSAPCMFTIHPYTDPGFISKNDTVCFGNNKDTLSLINNTGTPIDWLTSTNNGTSWQNTNHVLSYYIYQDLMIRTQYKAIIKSGTCAADTTPVISVDIFDHTPVSAGNDIEITRFESVMLQASGSGSVSWYPYEGLDNSNILQPFASPVNTTTYVLDVTDINGCQNSDTVLVKVFVPIPNVITPNDDGLNDEFIIPDLEQFQNNSLVIYNRWGNIVYKAAPYKNEWNGKTQNGKDLPDDSYFFVFIKNTGEKEITGFILIKR